MLEQKLMEALIGFGLIAGAALFGFYRAHQTARQEGKAARDQTEPIVQEVVGPPGEPGVREMLRAIGDDARDAKDAAVQAAAGGARMEVEVGALSVRVESIEHRVTALEGTAREVTDLRARVETVGALRASDRKKSDAATGVGATTTEGGPASARADRPENPPPPPQHGTLSEPGDGEQR
jgi:hypothetical protein